MTDLPSRELAQLINRDAIGVSMFLETMPETPTKCMALTTYSGAAPAYVHDIKGPVIDKPRVQVLARADTVPDCYDLIERAYRVLSRVHNEGAILKTMPLSMPFLLGRDQNNRPLYAFNVEIWKTTGEN